MKTKFLFCKKDQKKSKKVKELFKSRLLFLPFCLSETEGYTP